MARASDDTDPKVGTRTVEAIPSGISTLDGLLGGGWPVGSIITLEAPLTAPGEQVCEESIRGNSTLGGYFTTVRPSVSVAPRLEESDSPLDVSGDDGKTFVESLSADTLDGGLPPIPQGVPDTHVLGFSSGRAAVADHDRLTDAEPQSDVPVPAGDTGLAYGFKQLLCAENPNIVIDAMTDLLPGAHLEETPDGWRRLVDWLYLTVQATGAVAILHFRDDPSESLAPPARKVIAAATGHMRYVSGQETDSLRITQLQGLCPTNADIDTLPLSVDLEVLNTLSADPTKKA